MRYKIFDVEDNKERIISNCFTPLEVGTTRKVIIKDNGISVEHHFKVLEELREIN